MYERYSRQTICSYIGIEGQKQLADSCVLIIGAGALGTANAEGLARAGIGKIVLVDRDYVEWSNLQRQQLYTEEDAKNRLPKAIAAKAHLAKINSEITIEVHNEDADAEMLLPLMQKADVVIDATDNFDTRLIINDLAYQTNTPWIYGGCVSSQGMYMAFIPGETPCFSCVFTHLPTGGLTCDTAGIISPAVQMVAAFQQAEAIKLLTKQKQALRSAFFTFDLWENTQIQVKVAAMHRKHCPTCGDNPEYPHIQFENKKKSEVLCGRDTVQIRTPMLKNLPVHDLKERLQKLYLVEANDYLLHITFETYRIVLFLQDSRAFVHGTNDPKTANSVLARVIGL
ncbi:MoeB/ThiF family adenylyltransferase [Bacillus gobiensis]|uniref:MoeB/ThiF family adenylyltransferase n=1 Tax=Bacillus gobiensis TaxID=1441095 RepID=UPI003D1ED2D9